MKREPVGHERDTDGWLRNTLQSSAAAASETCLDAETLAAWADGGLSPDAAAGVERHASDCARCTAMLAVIERMAPAPARDAWTRARLFRWLVPLTAAATAVAVWIAVPDRPVTTPAPQDLRATSERRSTTPESEPASQEPAPSSQKPNAAPSPGNEARKMTAKAPAPSERDDLRRERATVEARGEMAGVAAEAPSAAPVLAAPQAAAAADAAAGAAPPTAQRPAFVALAAPV